MSRPELANSSMLILCNSNVFRTEASVFHSWLLRDHFGTVCLRLPLRLLFLPIR